MKLHVWVQLSLVLLAVGGTASHNAASCSEEKSLNQADKDGEYKLYPFATSRDVSLRVYCHDMASGNPKEFLTLPKGPDENYAIVFADQLADGSRCTGTLQKPYTSAGTTKFSKLRIKFEKCRVEVIRDDYTFAETTGPNEIDYGHAGDCYSRKQGCAKGTFKVDLTGTDLTLAPDVHWAMAPGHYWPDSLTINDMSISKDRKVASARCGGRCGHCWPVGKKMYLVHPQCKKPASCSELRSLNPKDGDGEYTLYPFTTNDVSLRVYCHDMASGDPKEFLTLAKGPDENYAIVFSDRLADGALCTGPLQEPYASAAGTTKFSKLRIKFEKCRVEVIRDDYTFARTNGPHEIDYGHAGDCYSKKQGCAKGTFKVDLTGTELTLAPDVHWAMAPGHYYPDSLTINDMSISKDRKVASARCGGWCGHCWPVGEKMHLLHPQCHKAASCADRKSLNPEADDGEYTLYPFPKDKDVSLRVYCHDMDSGSPKEFLTLPTGPDDNYAIVFSDRLADSAGGQCTGPLQDPYASRAGTTKFSKLRIKFESSRVEVIRDDYTFAKTTGPNDVDYGHAGDCYSWKQGCAKGTFNVDLTGTELALAPDVHWVMEERWPESLTINDMSISKDRKVASARCGGWCGHCWPAGKKMYLVHPLYDGKESEPGVVHGEL